jgi:hypothetical protein
MGVYMIEDDFRAIGISMGVREIALGDAWLQFASYDGSARDFFSERRSSSDPETNKAHWFAAPAADTVEHAAFYSLSAQGAYVREHGEAATRELLATEGLTLGKIKPAKADDPEGITGTKNPYSEKFVGSEAERQARITSIIKQGGTKLAASLAKSAGKTIDNKPLQKVGR